MYRRVQKLTYRSSESIEELEVHTYCIPTAIKFAYSKGSHVSRREEAKFTKKGKFWQSVTHKQPAYQIHDIAEDIMLRIYSKFMYR
jgi:hypothetical protein